MGAPLRYRYESFEFGEIDVHLRTLKNKNQFLDIDDVALKLGISPSQWSLFGVVWESSLVLALEVAKLPIQGLKILEVGCGIAISSHLLNAKGADITATDYHPEVQAFLDENTRLNQTPQIPFILQNWNSEASLLAEYDLIIGSDLLYESEHVELLSFFLHRHCKKKARIILVDPRRGHANGFIRAMNLLGFEHTVKKCSDSQSFKGSIYSFERG